MNPGAPASSRCWDQVFAVCASTERHVASSRRVLRATAVLGAVDRTLTHGAPTFEAPLTLDVIRIANLNFPRLGRTLIKVRLHNRTHRFAAAFAHPPLDLVQRCVHRVVANQRASSFFILCRDSQYGPSLAILIAAVRGIGRQTLPGTVRSGYPARVQRAEIGRVCSAAEDPHPNVNGRCCSSTGRWRAVLGWTTERS